MLAAKEAHAPAAPGGGIERRRFKPRPVACRRQISRQQAGIAPCRPRSRRPPQREPPPASGGRAEVATASYGRKQGRGVQRVARASEPQQERREHLDSGTNAATVSTTEHPPLLSGAASPYQVGSGAALSRAPAPDHSLPSGISAAAAASGARSEGKERKGKEARCGGRRGRQTEAAAPPRINKEAALIATAGAAAAAAAAAAAEIKKQIFQIATGTRAAVARPPPASRFFRQPPPTSLLFSSPALLRLPPFFPRAEILAPRLGRYTRTRPGPVGTKQFKVWFALRRGDAPPDSAAARNVIQAPAGGAAEFADRLCCSPGLVPPSNLRKVPVTSFRDRNNEGCNPQRVGPYLS
ncbi:putative uncharacterized protein ENSP00000383309 [Schistocerca serialis cubense]|uniref:putative uncharacterized protein ENSP00000383309 n=1 Tax=Schistocerca serialis cubense TaxID=2023355 RepID=UPI00214EF901|nr:putative uncharacterized protein ENSP00000383309 [Schistocerca serialis cubense]